jgi:hypothetical protein
MNKFNFTSRKALLALCLAVILLIASGLFLTNTEKYTKIACSQVNVAVEKELPAANKIEHFQKIYNEHFRDKECKKDSGALASIDQFKYYYNRVTIGADAGIKKEIISDADAGIKAYAQLSKKDQSTLKYKFMLKSIEVIKAEEKP